MASARVAHAVRLSPLGRPEEAEREPGRAVQIRDVPAYGCGRDGEGVGRPERVLLEERVVVIVAQPRERDLADLRVFSGHDGDLIVRLEADHVLPVVQFVPAHEVDRVSGVRRNLVHALHELFPQVVVRDSGRVLEVDRGPITLFLDEERLLLEHEVQRIDRGHSPQQSRRFVHVSRVLEEERIRLADAREEMFRPVQTRLDLRERVGAAGPIDDGDDGAGRGRGRPAVEEARRRRQPDALPAARRILDEFDPSLHHESRLRVGNVDVHDPFASRRREARGQREQTAGRRNAIPRAATHQKFHR